MNPTIKQPITLLAACLTIGLCSLPALAQNVGKDLKHATAHMNRSLNKASKSTNRNVNKASKSANRNAKRNSKRINHNVPKEAKRETKDLNHTMQGDPEGTSKKK
jgi:hypothetical protein